MNGSVIGMPKLQLLRDFFYELEGPYTVVKLTAEAVERLHDVFARASTETDFGNGRLVRNVLEQARMAQAVSQGIPFTNYGIAIAFMTGTLERSLRLFPALHSLLEGGLP